MNRKIAAVSRAVIVVVVIVIIVIAAAGAVALSMSKSTTTSQIVTTSSYVSSSSSSSAPLTSSSTMGTTSSSSSSTSTTSMSSLTTSATNSTSLSTTFVSSTTSNSSGATINTFSYDAPAWPTGDLDQLNEWELIPYPDWGEYTVYQPLVAANLTAQQEGVIQFLPALASSWSTSDNQTWTFNLLQNVNFSNGDPFNAYEVWAQMYSFYYLSANSSGFFEGYQIFNMNTSNFGPADVAMLNTTNLANPTGPILSIMENSSWPIYVTGPYTIVFREAHPFPFLLGILVSTVGLAIDMQWVFENGGLGTPTSPNGYFAQHPIPGTGPYTFTQVSEDAYVKMAQNPSYWGDALTPAQIAANPALDPGHAKNIVIYAKSDDLTRYVDLSGGSVQAATIIDNFGLVIANPTEYSFFLNPKGSGMQSYISLNTQIAPTNITAVRQAIAHAINYSAIYSQIYYGYMTPAFGPEYPAWPQYYDIGNYTMYSYNVTLAQQILKNASINPATLPAIQIQVQNSCGKGCVGEAEIVQADLAQIGLTVNIQVMTFGQWCTNMCQPYSEEITDPQNVAGICAYCWQTTLALTPVDEWITAVGATSPVGNEAIYTNSEVQACLNAFEDGNSTTQIQAVCGAAQKLIYNDVPYIWIGTNGLYDQAGTVVWKSSVVKGMYGDPLYAGFSSDPLFNTVTFVAGS